MKEIISRMTELKINALLQDIHSSFNVSAGLFDISGQPLGEGGVEARSNLCRFIHFYDTKQICRQSYLQCFCQCQREQRPLISFCPFGLVNFTFPVPGCGETPCFVVVGPLLYQKPDDAMIGNILNLNSQLLPRAREIRKDLNEIEVRSESQAQSMLLLIENALLGVSTLFPPKECTAKDDVGNDLRRLRHWQRLNPRDDEEQAFRGIIDTLLPTMPTWENDFNDEALEKNIAILTNHVFSAADHTAMIYRAVKYFEFLTEFAGKNGIDLKSLFPPEYRSIDDLIHEETPEALRNAVILGRNSFMESCAIHREVYDKDVIFRSIHYIRSHYSDISLSDVAEYVNLNPTYFSNLFKRSTGQSYSHYLNKIRIEESKRLLLQNYNISEIAQNVGFSDQSYFTNVFKKLEGVPPLRWKTAQEKGGSL